MNVKEEKKLYSQREKYRQKAFLMMLEIAVIIALPALAAFLVGKYLDKNNPDSKTYTLFLLLGSFVLSWTIIIIKYIKFNRKVKETDRKIRGLKDKNDANNSDSSN